MTAERHSFEASLAIRTSDQSQLTTELKELTTKFASLEEVLAERTRHREEYVAKVAVLEEQLNSAQIKLADTEREIFELRGNEAEISRKMG